MLNYIPPFVQRPIAILANRSPWLSRIVNKLAINEAINVSRHRPHPWSTAHDYVSWTSLTNQLWMARHLPAADLQDLPRAESLKGFFLRTDDGQVLSSKSTCLFPAFAQYLTDGFIRTKMPNTSKGEQDDPLRRQNTSNHNIDLCTLYGRNERQTQQLRVNSTNAELKGRLKSQIISGEEYSPFLFESDGVTTKSEFNELDVPLGIDNCPIEYRANIFAAGGDRVNGAPQVAMINTLFLREHNRVAAELAMSNPNWDDERVFQTARNTVIVLFIKIVVEEYINHISGIPFELHADPSIAWNAAWNKPNWITAEFSLLYRWHSLVPDTITWSGTPHPVATTFMNNQLLLSAGLVGAFAGISSQKAGRLGPFNTAEALIGLEVKAIEQGRLCRLDSYANYREYVSLQRPKKFSDISKNKRVVEFLAQNYPNVDSIEFYIGLFAEDPDANTPLPPLISRMVALDAFSQAFTNPLLSEHVFRPDTFSEVGWRTIQMTRCLADVVDRNSASGVGSNRIGMTVNGWKYH